MLELRAKHPLSKTIIIERFIDGVRFMKVTPRMIVPLIKENLINMFKGKNVEITESDNGWLKIEKLERNEEAEEALKKTGLVNDTDIINESFILNKEAEMLTKQGFEVKVKEITENE